MNWAELSIPLADNVYVKNIYMKNYFAYAEKDDSSRIRYPTESKSAGFQSHFEEVWYNKTFCGWLYIYIYIYT